jgi:Tol biopolymer transport system component
MGGASEDSGMTLGELHLISADGRAVNRITRDESAKLRPAWSPEGSWIVYERAIERRGYHLFAVHPDGTGLRQITGPAVEAPSSVSVVPEQGQTRYVAINGDVTAVEEICSHPPAVADGVLFGSQDKMVYAFHLPGP